MKLITNCYYMGQNHVIGKCDKCGETVSGLAQDNLSLSCQCGKTNFRRLPLHYLINNNPSMIVFSLKNKHSGKELIGVTNDGSSKNYHVKIDEEIKNIIDNNLYPDLVSDIEQFGLSDFKIKKLGIASTMKQAMHLEKMYINARNTMEPDGYNTCYVYERVLKPKKS